MLPFAPRSALLLVLLLLLLSGPAAVFAQQRLLDFSGAVYGMSPTLGETGVGWNRELEPGAFDWASMQPNRSSAFLWDKTDTALEAAQQRGSRILPILAYTPGWAQSNLTGCSYPATNRSDWEQYVAATVGRYTAKGVTHWQIWNEAGWPNKPFFCGTEASFVLDVYLPAARIIRAHGGKVVFGGWVSIYGIAAYKELLLLGDGSETVLEMTDVLCAPDHTVLLGACNLARPLATETDACYVRRDVHYHGVSELVDLYEWANGTKGMWMSELGYLTFPAYLPNVYLRYLHYAASDGRWKHADDFVLMWYASWGAGPDAQKCLSFTNSSGDQQLSTHGQHLALMSRLFRNETITALALDHFTTVPSLSPQTDEETSAAMGFRLGEDSSGVVFALLLGNNTWTGSDMTMTITFDLQFSPTALPNCDMVVAPTGDIHRLSPRRMAAAGENQVELTVPVGKSPLAVARAFGGPKDPFAVSVSYVTCA